MKALRINVGSPIELVDITPELRTYQEIVQGYICTCTFSLCPPQQAVMIVNDEGLIDGLPENLYASCLRGGLIVGNALIVGVFGDDFTDVPEFLASAVPDLNEQIAAHLASCGI